ncbi:MAG: DUF5683 domain-containing protein [Bacteroidota bacterium]
MIKILLICMPFFLWLSTHGQEMKRSDSIIDSTRKHSIKKAIILSACLPGAGQIYNHKAMPKGQKKAFWKVPLIYTGLGATSYFLIQNQMIQASIKKEYSNRLTGGIVDPTWEPYDNQALVSLQRQYLDNRDLSMLLFFLMYGLQVADAGIEAHFVSFDVSDDISLRIKPKMFQQDAVGLSVQLKFH